MRVTFDLAADAAAIPVHDSDGKSVGELWSRRLDWRCRDRRLDLQVIAVEPVALPEPEPSEPPESAIARIETAVARTGTLILLRNPSEAFGPGRISFTEGVRLFSIASDADEACWDAMLSLGQPVYGVRGLIACEVLRPHPASVLSALAYGLFVCEEGARLVSLLEDRAGVAWEVADAAAKATVVIRGGYEAAILTGASGSWKDRGNEGYVRVVVRAGEGACWTQPRFIASTVPASTTGA